MLLKILAVRKCQTPAIISPDANDKIKLKNFSDELLKAIPIIPPNVVPKVPKNKPINVVFTNSSNLKSPYIFF